jgi:hypothetical protein
MASELNMYQAQVAEYKYDIERLTKELAGLKTKYFESKKREQLEREVQRAAAGTTSGGGMGPGSKAIAAVAAGQQRFVGGGFSLNSPVAGQ